MNYKKIKMVIAGLGGRGHDIYSNYGLEHPDEMEVIAIADPRPDRLKIAREEWGIPEERCYATAEELFAQEKMADAAVIATQDQQHVAHAEAALKAGYHLLLEKPVAVDIKGCQQARRQCFSDFNIMPNSAIDRLLINNMFAHGFYPARVRMEMRLVFLVPFTKQICSPQKAICQMVQNSCYIKTLYWESLTWISKEWDLPHSTQI